MFDTLEVEVPSAVEEITDNTFADARAKYLSAVEELALQIHTDPNINLDDTTTRFSTALNIRYLREKTICLVGVGGIGNWVVKVLISMGVTKLIIIDDDIVELHNVCPQNFGLVDLGVPKVQAAADVIMQHSGVAIRTIQKKVDGFVELVEECQCVPDIIITAVDNMEFRNTFADGLCNRVLNSSTTDSHRVPELFIDLRMALGDWTAYAIPTRAILQKLGYEDRSMLMYNRYIDVACFLQEDAVQEPCTARAIGYTGANIASFVGAYLHWYTNEGRLQFSGNAEEFPDARMAIKDYFDMAEYQKSHFKMHTTFSSRDWEFITPTAQAKGFQAKIRQLNSELDKILEDYESMKSHVENMTEVLFHMQAELTAKSAIPAHEVPSVAAEPSVLEIVQELATLAPLPEETDEPIEVNQQRVIVGTEFRLVDEDYYFKVTDISSTNVTVLNLGTLEQERVSLRVLTTLCADIEYND